MLIYTITRKYYKITAYIFMLVLLKYIVQTTHFKEGNFSYFRFLIIPIRNKLHINS